LINEGSGVWEIDRFVDGWLNGITGKNDLFARSPTQHPLIRQSTNPELPLFPSRPLRDTGPEFFFSDEN